MKERRKMSKTRMMLALGTIVTVMLASSMVVFAAEEGAEYVPAMYGTFWSLVPAVVAIVLALITKEVYSSLFAGIVMGALFYASFNVETATLHVLETGIVGSLTDSYNAGNLVFLVLLGTLVCLMNKAGGSAAFGQWAIEHIKTRVGAQLATIALGCIIFVDDYFNCLTVGSVMKPVTDKFKISRAKLAYLIDATAAPICIIAPVSSWAAAVTGYVDGEDGFAVFINAIPYNFYAILTIVMMITIVCMKKDYGPMKLHEDNAMKHGDLYTTGTKVTEEVEDDGVEKKGKVIDLVLPIVSLVSCCLIGMLYTGGFFSGVDFVNAFADCNAPLGLSLGSLFALFITVIFYCVRKVLSFTACMECLPEGFKAMVPPILILTFAWTLKTMTDSLGATVFVQGVMESSAEGLVYFLPAIIFIVGCLLAFSTGTSWGTFGILIPIVVGVFQGVDYELMIISISACMAGAVCGDHCSPISDTTIMASAGAQCNHVNHVSTQLPYAITVAAVSFVTYIIAGFVQSAWIALPIGIVLMLGTMFVINKVVKDEA
ncbi:MAG: Na+/H+ antiporter NhaC family protein [Eubacteriales bacterium]